MWKSWENRSRSKIRRKTMGNKFPALQSWRKRTKDDMCLPSNLTQPRFSFLTKYLKKLKKFNKIFNKMTCVRRPIKKDIHFSPNIKEKLQHFKRVFKKMTSIKCFHFFTFYCSTKTSTTHGLDQMQNCISRVFTRKNLILGHVN